MRFMTAENDRKRLTFAQAEGVEPLPSQLKPKEISQELRAKLWGVFHTSLQTCSSRDNCFVDPWAGILRDKHVLLDHNMVDDFNNNTVALSKSVRAIFEFGDYIKLLGFVEW